MLSSVIIRPRSTSAQPIQQVASTLFGVPMSIRTPRPSGKGSTRPPLEEEEDSYPHIPEPKQNHVGSLLAFVSVLAVLGFGFWTAFGTLTAPDKTVQKPSPTLATTPVAASSAPTAAPTAGVAAQPVSASAPVSSSTPRPTNSGKVHVVGAGDTLYKIAHEYGTTVDALMAANGITDRSKILHVGEKLNIP